MKTFLFIAIVSSSIPITSSAGGCHSKKSNQLDVLWSGGEHVQLGNLGFEKACAEYGVTHTECLSNSIPRADNKLKLNYGQIIALGDFFKTVERAYFSKKSVRKLGKIFKCMDKEGSVHHEQRTHPEVKYPDCTWVNILNSSEYLKLVSTNHKHFSWHNMKEYTLLHEKALKLAVKARELKLNNQHAEAIDVLSQAIYSNAFADHYLTDAFPAGHLRVPRVELKQWAKKGLSGFLKSYRADSLAAVLHDNDSKDPNGKEVGIKVKNSRGDIWITKADENLNTCSNENSPVIALPVTAVKLSVQELLKAYFTGEIPTGIFAASHYVPFPIENNLGDLRTRLKPQYRSNIKRLHKSLPLPLRLITPKRDISKMLKSLPKIMRTFSKSIRKDLSKSDHYKKRLPKAYLDAFSNIK